jgi:hypothetical protein
MIALAFSAFADDGKVDCPGITSPPSESTTEDGQMGFPGVTSQTDPLTQAALTIIQSVLLLS